MTVWSAIVDSVTDGYRRELYEEYINDLDTRCALGELISSADDLVARDVVAALDTEFCMFTYECERSQGKRPVWSLAEGDTNLAQRIPPIGRNDFEEHPMFCVEYSN